MVWQHSNVSFDIRKNTIRCHTGGHSSFTVQIKLKCHKKIQRGWFIISVMIKLKWRPLTILKRSNKSLRSNIFLICKSMYILKVYSIHCILRQNTTLKKISFGQNKRYKKCPFFLSRASAHHCFTFNLRFFYKLKYKVRLCKTVSEIFRFRFRFVFIKVYIFVQQNAWTLWL